MKKAILSIGIMIIIAVGLSGCSEKRDDSNELNQSQAFNSVTQVDISLSDIDDVAKFCGYDADGIEVKYFVVMGSDGDVHAAFDACEMCYSKKIGYRQEGEMMICISCPNEKYAINDLGTKNTAGKCWPSYLPIKINEDYVIIEKSDLEQKKWMF